MTKYEGYVVMIRPGTKLGKIIFNGGGESAPVFFPDTIEHGDKVLVSFKDNDISKAITSIETKNDTLFYGYIFEGNKQNQADSKHRKIFLLPTFPKIRQIMVFKENMLPGVEITKILPVKFFIQKNKNLVYPSNVEVVSENEKYLCFVPNYGKFVNGNFVFYFRKKDGSIQQRTVKPNSNLFFNFIEPYSDEIYMGYFSFNDCKSIRRLNMDDQSELINCFKYAIETIKLSVVDTLISWDLFVKQFDSVTLLRKKEELIRNLIANNKKNIELQIELQRIKYDPSMLKNNEHQFYNIEFTSITSDIDVKIDNSKLSKWNFEL